MNDNDECTQAKEQLAQSRQSILLALLLLERNQIEQAKNALISALSVRLGTPLLKSE